MHVDDRAPLLVGHLLDHAVPGVTGVVHNDVEPAETVDARLDEAFGKAVLRHAAGADCNLAAGGADRLGGVVGRIGV